MSLRDEVAKIVKQAILRNVWSDKAVLSIADDILAVVKKQKRKRLFSISTHSEDTDNS